MGWKSENIPTDAESVIENQCSGFEKHELETCIVEKTFGRSEVFTEAFLGDPARTPLLDWEEDFAATREMGMTYNLNMEGRLGTDGRIHQIYILFDYDKAYDIFIHDSNFFMMNQNPNGPPSKYMKIKPNNSFNHYNQLALTKHYEMNIPKDPCVEDPGYIFKARM